MRCLSFSVPKLFLCMVLVAGVIAPVMHAGGRWPTPEQEAAGRRWLEYEREVAEWGRLPRARRRTVPVPEGPPRPDDWILDWVRNNLPGAMPAGGGAAPGVDEARRRAEREREEARQAEARAREAAERERRERAEADAARRARAEADARAQREREEARRAEERARQAEAQQRRLNEQLYNVAMLGDAGLADVQNLLAAGADPTIVVPGPDRFSMVQAVLANGVPSRDVMAALLNSRQFQNDPRVLGYVNQYGYNILHVAARARRPDVFELLVGRVSPDVANARNGRGETPLYLTMLYGCSACVDILLARLRANPNIPFPGENNDSPLGTAAFRRDHSLINALNRAAADFAHRNKKGLTPLHLYFSGQGAALPRADKQAIRVLLGDLDPLETGYPRPDGRPRASAAERAHSRGELSILLEVLCEIGRGAEAARIGDRFREPPPCAGAAPPPPPPPPPGAGAHGPSPFQGASPGPPPTPPDMRAFPPPAAAPPGVSDAARKEMGQRACNDALTQRLRSASVPVEDQPGQAPLFGAARWARAILGVPRETSATECKRVYKKLIAAIHPNRYMASPPEVLEYYTCLSQAVTAADQVIQAEIDADEARRKAEAGGPAGPVPGGRNPADEGERQADEWMMARLGGVSHTDLRGALVLFGIPASALNRDSLERVIAEFKRDHDASRYPLGSADQYREDTLVRRAVEAYDRLKAFLDTGQ